MMDIARSPIENAGAFTVGEVDVDNSGDPFTSNARDNIFATGEYGMFEATGSTTDEKEDEDTRNRRERRAGTAPSDEQQRPQPVAEKALRVPRDDPLRQTVVPPEVVFFGDPRKPPPIEAARDVKYHGTLLLWARHATVAPRTSEERLASVFPRGRLSPESPKYRLTNSPAELTYKKIFDGFVAVMDDLEASKAFIEANMDLCPSTLFLRALTAQKLSAQSRNDLVQMEHVKEVRKRYILASDQMFFPLNIEVQKAETRVMTYLARQELRSWGQQWDEVEMTLHFVTLLAARLTWDQRVRELLDDIKRKIDSAVGYMAENIRDDLMTREFRKPGITSELYLNASKTIEIDMPELYAKIRPEVKFINEVFFMREAGEMQKFAVEVFCPREKISPDQLKERLQILDASLAAIQGMDYSDLRLFVESVIENVNTVSENDVEAKWYTALFAGADYGFDTYEPDELPTLLAVEQRFRDTGSAFDNFNVQILKAPTKYTPAFAGGRPKGQTVGNWLERDSEWTTENPASYEERIEKFKEAYVSQSQARQEAESRLMRLVVNRMDSQDRAIMGSQGAGFVSRVLSVDDDEEE